MKPISNDVKNAFKQPTTKRKGRILVDGNYYDVYNVEYYSDCYDEGKVIGNAIASQLDFDIPYMPKFDTFQYFDGIMVGNNYEYIDFGTFTVFDEQDEDEFNKHITAFDNLIKFNAPFEDVGGYPKSLYNELVNVCNQAGVTLANLTIPNGNFIVENNQFVNGESLKTVLKQICGISGTYGIVKNNNLNLQLKNTTSETIVKNQHEPVDWKRRSYGINQVIIGNSQVEGEYVIREDPDDIALNGVHKLEILDNLFAYTQNKRNALIDDLWNQVKGFGYIPYETKGEWLSYLEVGDTINIDGTDTILLRINAKSPNALESIISAPAIIDSSIEYVDNTNDIKNQLKRTELIVDKQNQTIQAVVKQIEDIVTTTSETEVGNPLYIENAQNEKPIEFELYGDTKQDGTPTPDNPVDIETVTGKQKISVYGKNIFDYTSTPNSVSSQLTKTIIDNGIRLTTNQSSISQVSWFARYLLINIENYANQKVTLSVYCQKHGTVTPMIYIGTCDYSGNNRVRLNNSSTLYDGQSSITATLPSSITSTNNYLFVNLYAVNNTTVTENDYVDFTNVQLEFGEEATPYTPYNSKFYEINLGKNLYDPSFRRSGGTINGNNCTVTESNGVFTLTATGTDAFMWGARNTGDSYDTNRGKLYEFDAENYTVTISNTLFTKNFVTFYDENLVSLGYTSKSSNTFSFSKSDKTNAKYFTLRIGYGSATIGQSYLFTVQLEKGTQATTYSPYKEPIELCKIDNYADKIYKENNKWYLYKVIGKVVLDGSESYTQRNIGDGSTTVSFNLSNFVMPYGSDKYCNYFVYSQNSQDGNEGYGTSQDVIYFEIKRNRLSTINVAGFKDWLSTHNTEVYYVLTTPTKELITDEELINQLDAFELETGINNITNNSFDLAGDMYLKYYLQTPISDTYVNRVEMYSELKITADEITSTVAEIYATKETTNELSSRISQTAKSIGLTVTDNSTSAGITIKLYNEDGTEIDSEDGNITLSGKVAFTDLSTSNPTTTIINGDNITTGTIKSSNYVANTSGTKIDLSNGTIDSKDFKVSSTGSITATGGNIGGWSIDSNKLSKTTGNYVFEIATDAPSDSPAFRVYDNVNQRYNFFVTPDGYLYGRNVDISGVITSTSGTIGGFTLGSVSLSGTTTNGTMRLQRGSSASVDFPANGGRLMIGSTASNGVALTTANKLIISDQYGDIAPSYSNAQIEIRSLNGQIRIASNYAIRLSSTSAYVQNTNYYLDYYTCRTGKVSVVGRGPSGDYEYYMAIVNGLIVYVGTNISDYAELPWLI